MDIVIYITVLFYLLSTAGYLLYLFIQKNYLHQAGRYLLITGFLWHSAAIIYWFIQTGAIPVHNLREIVTIAGWAVAGVFIIFQYKFNLKILGIYAAPFVAIVMIIASQLPAEFAEAKNVFNSFWLVLHIITIFIGNACFALACGLGILYLMQERAIKTKRHGFFFKRLPSLEMLDYTGYVCIVIGFTFLSIALAAGFVYAKSVWGKLWSWDPREVWSGIAWILYAVLLHKRLTVGWRGRRSAIIAIIGFAVLLFAFLGVNFFLKGAS